MKNLFSVLFLIVFVFAGGAAAQKTRAISEIQGEKNASDFVNEPVRTSGIVTARTRSGFFIQTPDDKVDGNPNTSEGILVFTRTEPGSEATIGNLVTLTGTIEEFRPKSETSSLPITEIRFAKGKDVISVESKNNPLPKPVTLTVRDFSANKLDQIEKYEGMRIFVETLTAVSPTGGRVEDKNATAESNGTFFAVLKGITRPFREPGMDVYDYFAPDNEKIKKDYPKMPLFDNNPERLRIESTAQLGASAIDVNAKAEIKNLSGVLHYAYRTYTIYVDVDSKHTVSNTVKPVILPPAKDNQFSIAATNLENFFDDEDDPSMKEDIVTKEAFALRLKKISAAIREYLQMPDIIGTIEVENLSALKRLAEKINADAQAAGKPNPKYEAFLIEGNDGRGIDNGLLVKTSRVEVVSVKQFGKDEKYENPVRKSESALNDRPPLVLEARINDPKTNKPFAVTVIVNHLKSFNGYNDDKDAPNVRLKKRLQAEYLAKLVAERQKANPNERILLVGDFNAYQFNDGIVDVIGTIKGTPAPKDQVLNPSEDFLNPDLTDLIDKIREDQRYSYSFDGNAQVLDHFLANDAMKKHLAGFGYLRVNADYSETLRGDASRVERYSDHDIPVGYFTFDEAPAPKN
jgi:predicted extracellular nuclease